MSYDQHEILRNIRQLHLEGDYDMDMTFGSGQFWKGDSLTTPPLCFDKEPACACAIKADCTSLPLRNESIRSAVCDLPFLTYIKGGRDHKQGGVSMSKRFSGYYSYDDLAKSYRGSLQEAGRVLTKNGVLVFKCQDIVHNHRLHPTHINAVSWAHEYGLRLVDLFVLAAKHRMPSPQKGTQRHARIHHSYFLVFRKV